MIKKSIYFVMLVLVIHIFVFSTLVNAKTKDKDKDKDKENFTLSYSSFGSELPIIIKLNISENGECIYKASGFEDDNKNKVYKYTLSKKEFKKLKNTLITKGKFFNLPSKYEPAESKMDQGTVKLTISYNGKIYSIGGYGAYNYEPYIPAFKAIEKLNKKIIESPKKVEIIDYTLEKLYIHYETKKPNSPIVTKFTISRKGYCLYETTNPNDEKQNKIVEYLLSKEDLNRIAKKFINDFKFFKVPKSQITNENCTSKMYIHYGWDYNEIFVNSEDDKRYIDLFLYMKETIKSIEEMANKPVNPNEKENFYLKYEVKGSEYPIELEFTINENGMCSYVKSVGGYADSPSSHEDIKYQLSEKNYKRLVDSIINKSQFFKLPLTMPKDHPAREMMDASTIHVLVSYKGKVHSIGGYNSDDYEKYKDIYAIINEYIALRKDN